MKSKSLLTILSTLVLSISLTGCGVIREGVFEEPTVPERYTGTSISSELLEGRYYVWHDENQNDIYKDINVDPAKFADYTDYIFKPVFMERVPEDNGIVWFYAENEKYIPTLYEGDELIYYAGVNSIPGYLELSRYYDHGYSIGLYGFRETIPGSNQYAININSAGYHSKGGADDGIQKIYQMGSYYSEENGNSIVSIPKIGGVPLSSDNISTIGTIKGLNKGSIYDIDIYIGTRATRGKVIADTHILYPMENFSLYEYDLIGSGIMRIKLPDYLKTGYYCINGMGLFRYVKEDSYNDKTDFNSPVILKDVLGDVLYSPQDEIEYKFFNNIDAINDSEYKSSDLYSVEIDDETDIIVTSFEFSDGKRKNPPIPEMKCYYSSIESYNTMYLSDEEKARVPLGYYANPIIFKLTDEDIANGTYKTIISGLEPGRWVIEYTNVGSYATHIEKVKKMTIYSDDLDDIDVFEQEKAEEESKELKELLGTGEYRQITYSNGTYEIKEQITDFEAWKREFLKNHTKDSDKKEETKDYDNLSEDDVLSYLESIKDNPLYNQNISNNVNDEMPNDVNVE